MLKKDSNQFETVRKLIPYNIQTDFTNYVPGVGVAMPIAFEPVGVTPLGVMDGVPIGVPIGVEGVPGVCGVIAEGVMADGVIWFDGVSSHRLLLLLIVPGVS